MAVGNHSVIGVPPGTRLLRISRLRGYWIVWTATSDYVHGTYLRMYDSGKVVRVTVRIDEGDEEFVVRPTDKEIGLWLE